MVDALRCRARDFRAALDYVIAGGHAEWAQRLGMALHAFWDRLDPSAEGRARLGAILALGGAEARRSRPGRRRPVMPLECDRARRLRRHAPLHDAALEVYRELGDQKGIITELTGIGFARARPW